MPFPVSLLPLFMAPLLILSPSYLLLPTPSPLDLEAVDTGENYRLIVQWGGSFFYLTEPPGELEAEIILADMGERPLRGVAYELRFLSPQGEVLDQATGRARKGFIVKTFTVHGDGDYVLEVTIKEVNGEPVEPETLRVSFPVSFAKGGEVMMEGEGEGGEAVQAPPVLDTNSMILVGVSSAAVIAAALLFKRRGSS